MSAAPWLGGQRVTAERLAEMLNKWSNWTPTWSTTTGAHIPSYGNAIVDCRYTVSGDLVTAYYNIQFGSTTNFNGGTAADNWIFSLPLTAAGAVFIGGSGWGQQDTFLRAPMTPRFFDVNNFEIEITGGRVDGNAIANTGLVDAVSPWTWGSGHGVFGILNYEKA